MNEPARPTTSHSWACASRTNWSDLPLRPRSAGWNVTSPRTGPTGRLSALARAELALGREEDADRDFQACLAGRPDDPRVWRDYLSMLYDLGNQDAWTVLLAKVPPSAESESEIWRFRGLLKEKTGDWAGAARTIEWP